MQTLRTQDWTRFSGRNNVYKAKFNLRTLWTIVLPQNTRSSNDYNCFHTIATITAYNAV